MAEKITQGICLFYKQTGENEFIVHFLFDTGLKSFFAQGLTKPLSKNRSNLISGSICEIEYFGSRLNDKIGRLKKSNLIKLPNIENFANKKTITRLIELFYNVKRKKDLIILYNDFIEKLGYGKNAVILSIFLARSTIFLSIAPNFKSCTVCHKSNQIVQFDLTQGGFLCYEHQVAVKFKSSVTIQEWFLLFNEPLKYFEVISKSNNIEILNLLLAFYRDNGYYFNW
ncbi:recombination protein O N-terminal domain-containing protein [Mycoplasmopsis pullorum]|uniref:recombination protein O N-terminal domain-containing protein n=1 Tax=Mycoplasmopsis pullorum TaxID=48003 RepID=UPI00111944FA|nr:recombination protein O N-terminal domain-containing protein [Mycoplasmopsis pullorum]TNK83480.1 hypothetical protein C4M93_02300 [Mycoplasmopsis pullorum]